MSKPLRNPKHEAFCQAYVRGATAGNATRSYKAVYGKADRKSATRCLQRADIRQRVDDIQGQVAAIEAGATAKALDRLAVTKEAVLAELAKIGFSNMLDYIRITDGGDPVVDLSRLDRDRAAAVQEVVVDTYVEGGGEDAREVKRVRFKLGDKRSALVDLGKHLGMFVERQRIPHEDAEKTDDELRDEIKGLALLLDDLGISLGGTGGGDKVDGVKGAADREPGKAE